MFTALESLFSRLMLCIARKNAPLLVYIYVHLDGVSWDHANSTAIWAADVRCFCLHAACLLRDCGGIPKGFAEVLSSLKSSQQGKFFLFSVFRVFPVFMCRNIAKPRTTGAGPGFWPCRVQLLKLHAGKESSLGWTERAWSWCSRGPPINWAFLWTQVYFSQSEDGLIGLGQITIIFLGTLVP